MHVRRTILCLAAAFLWAAHDPDVASGQSSEFMEAFSSFKTLYQQGRYSEAELYAEEALRLGKAEFGLDHPYTASLLNNLARLYQAQGRYAEAEPPYKRSLAIREKALEPEHPDVAQSLNNLAGLYRAQGRYPRQARRSEPNTMKTPDGAPECRLLAKTCRQSHFRRTSGMPPALDILAAMSGFELNPSGMPSGPDVADALGVRGKVTRSSHPIGGIRAIPFDFCRVCIHL